jgi:PAS domain S-box-containing protein
VSRDSDPARRDYETLVRAALIGAGTSVWEWNPQTDVLSGVDSDLNLLGYGPEEGRLTQQAWNLLIHPDDCAENDEHFLRHARGELPYYEHEYRARTKDGQWRWIAERGRIVEWSTDGKPLRVVGTLVDVTQRHQAESRALAIAAQLSETARHVPGVIYQYRHNGDGDGAFCYVSESCFDVLGLTASEVMRDGAAVLRMIEREHYGSTIAAMKLSARTLTPWRFDFRLRRPDGALRWMTGTSTPQRESDGGVLWYGYFEDSTEVHELQLARQSAAMAQAANRAKTEFLSHMSHELRTPLNAVMGFAQLLQIDESDPLSPNQRRRVALIHEAGDHLLQMISELLDLTRIESGQLALDCTEVQLPALLAECMDMLHPLADAASVRLLPIEARESLTVHADATRLRQVVLNLVCNAIKYNRPEGTVRVLAESATDGVRVQVIDTGVGISQAQLPTLGEPFNRLDHRHSAIEGTGIGLAVTRGLIQLMSGRLDVESTLGEGSTFSVFLPEGPTPGATTRSPSLPT